MLAEWFGWREAIDIQLPIGTTLILPMMIGWKYAGFNVAIFLSGLLILLRDTN
jgi:hypothetical protein